MILELQPFSMPIRLHEPRTQGLDCSASMSDDTIKSAKELSESLIPGMKTRFLRPALWPPCARHGRIGRGFRLWPTNIARERLDLKDSILATIAGTSQHLEVQDQTPNEVNIAGALESWSKPA